MDMELVNNILVLVNSGGVVGILVIILVLFYRGKILPDTVYERLLRQFSTEFADRLCAEMAETFRAIIEEMRK